MNEVGTALKTSRPDESRKAAAQGISLLVGQQRVLEMVASAAPLDDTLAELTRFIEAQEEGLRCGILIVTEDGKHFRRGSGPNLPEAYHRALDGVPITPPYLGACGQCAHTNTAVVVPDIANDVRWSDDWRNLVLSCGLASMRSTPVRGSDGRTLASFAMYYDQPRDPSPAHPELVDIATHLAGIAIERAQSEAALRASEEFNRRILQSSQDCIKVLDLEGRLLSINACGLAALEVGDPSQVSGASYVELWVGDDLEAAREAVRLALAGGIGRFTGFYRTPSGQETWWDEVVTPILDATGKPERLLVVSRDITERKRAEQAQRESEERLRLIVESAREYAIITLDGEGRITSWNSGARRILGYEASEILGQPAQIFFTPDDIAAGRPEIEMRRAREEGRATNERWHVRKDRSRFWASGVTLPLANGHERGFLQIFRDRTEERRAEEALRESQEFNQRIIESTEDCVKVLDLDGRLAWISRGGQEALEICDVEPLIGTSWIDFWVGGDRAIAEDSIRSAAGGHTSRFSGWAPTLTGKDKYWESIITPILAAEGMPERLLAVSRDMTERKRSEEQRMLLINELNHRVKNTLATVQSMAMQTLRNSQDTTQAQQQFQTRLMALSRAHDILTQENWEGASLRRVVEEVGPHCGQGTDRFDIDGPDVRISPRYALALAMALHELCTNAVKYGALSNDEGRVEIVWAVAGGDGARELRMRWTEAGGPPVEPPSRRGFGSRLVERGLAHDLGGDARIDFVPTGVACTINAPLAHAGGGKGDASRA